MRTQLVVVFNLCIALCVHAKVLSPAHTSQNGLVALWIEANQLFVRFELS
jgi:hypothetical protein